MTIISRAPVRISFGGGGTDLASYYEKYGGVVVSAAINKYFYTVLELREDERIQLISSDLQINLSVRDFYDLKFGEGLDIPVAVIKHFGVERGMNMFMASEIPPGTGLGSSGAVTVNIINVINHLEHLNMGKQEIAELAYHIEHDRLGMPIGKQDEYAAAIGGLNFMKFDKEGVTVEPLRINNEAKLRLEEDIMLFFTGRTRQSSNILKSQDNSCKDDEGVVIDSLHNIKRIAFDVKEALEEGDLKRFGKLLHESWENKKKLAHGISNERIDNAYSAARERGALGGKLTGAGGGGYLMLYCEKKYQKDVQNKLKEMGLQRIFFRFDMGGTHIISG